MGEGQDRHRLLRRASRRTRSQAQAGQAKAVSNFSSNDFEPMNLLQNLTDLFYRFGHLPSALNIGFKLPVETLRAVYTSASNISYGFIKKNWIRTVRIIGLSE